MKNIISEVVWKSLDMFTPTVGKIYLTTANINGEWTIPVVARYYKSGKFIMGYSFQAERVVEVAVETKPTHFAELPALPNGSLYV